MDYLTILTTCSLLLFTNEAARPTRSDSPGSAGPITPEQSTRLLPLTPINVSIESIVHSDVECAYFLLQHILRDISFDGGSADRNTLLEGEALVWQAMDRAKGFARAIGHWFAVHPKQRMGDKQLEALAMRHGVRLYLREKQTRGMAVALKSESAVPHA